MAPLSLPISVNSSAPKAALRETFAPIKSNSRTAASEKRESTSTVLRPPTRPASRRSSANKTSLGTARAEESKTCNAVPSLLKSNPTCFLSAPPCMTFRISATPSTIEISPNTSETLATIAVNTSAIAPSSLCAKTMLPKVLPRAL